jgi:steroid 5-alpha reductase family enzyme
MRSSNHRASLAVLLGLVAVAAVPAAVALSRQTVGVQLLDAVWAIPVAAVCGVLALLFARGARGRIRRTLERAGGLGRVRLGRILGVAGICVALSAAIAVGFYELLLRLEG